MKKAFILLVIICTMLIISGDLFAAERSLLGKWSVSFKGYYGNENIGTIYGKVGAVLRIKKQTGRSFAGTLKLNGNPNTYVVTGNIKDDNTTMIFGGNTFVRGNAYTTKDGTRLYLIMETQRMSSGDTQGVLDGTAKKL